MVRGALLVAAVGALALVLGAAIAGPPQDVPNDVIVTRLPESTTATTTEAPRRGSSATTTSAASRTVATSSTVTTAALRTTATTGPTVTAPPTSPTGAGVALAPESSVRLVVANATDAPGLAARTVAVLRTMGYSDAVPTDAVTSRLDTVIVHVDGRGGEASRLATQLGVEPSQVRLRQAERLTVSEDDADLWVLLGADRT